MEESNIYFATNTFNYGGFYSENTRNKFNDSKGNVDFFSQVMDYDALMKLKNSPKMHGTLNSNYYMAHIKQIRILDPNFSSVMLSHREKDLEILAENAWYDAEYGYSEKNDYYPLLGEIILDNKELSYADELLGKWMQADKGLDEPAPDAYGIFIKQSAKKDASADTVKPEDAGLEDTEDLDPYYYQYGETAGQQKVMRVDIDKAKLYEQTYGSIFRAFSEVSQEEIIQAPVEQWSFVNAGPGTGKTYTLMKKITYMIEELETDPESILVMCFTNAAVNEIKARIKKYAEEEGDRTFINVDVRTFHSFSWLLISQANELFNDRPNYRYIDISQLNFDQSIREATEIIQNFGDEVFGGCNHLIVDEIQDLTNERAHLVMTMVRECMKNGVGVTILGDSCQAIYDYSDDEKTCKLKSEQFYRYMFSDFYGRGKFYKLEKNHRQSDCLINVTHPLRTVILDGKKKNVREAIAKMKCTAPEITPKALSTKLSKDDLDRIADEGTLCLMCRNNAQVLATSNNLRKRGISHIVNAYDEFEYLADWIGKVFGLFTKEIMTKDEFIRFSESCNTDILPEVVWGRLQELIGSENNVLKVREILKAIAKSKVDDPIFRNVPRGKLIVSNIHKSKGREYDSVIVEQKFVKRMVKDSTSEKSDDKYLEEAKTLYVAVTRPRKKLYFNNLAVTNVSLKRIKTGRKRWVRGDGKNLKRIEIRACSDADINSYNKTDLQEYIIENVMVGDEIKLAFENDDNSATYNIVHVSNVGERIVGRTTADFIEDVDAIISPYGSPWPRRITDLYVSGIHSRIAKDFNSVWCWIDFCGLGTTHTDIY